ncbi:MAG: transketolase [Alphaproteobacteria bacterium]|nr:transketolase [Alphaproteobacteria bacterium]
MATNEDLKNISNAIKMLSAVAVEKAKSGHPGTPVGAADIMAVLFANHLKFNPFNPEWKNRDRFVLSAGHACIMLYSALHLFGYKKFSMEDLKNLRQINSITSGHPEFEIDAGIETTTGPLGEGVSASVGMAIAEKILNSKFSDIINHKVYTFVGDGCLMEGVAYEALSLAGHLKLNNLIVIYDRNDITIDGALEMANSENIAMRMEAMGFAVQEIDGHNFDEINMAVEKAKQSNKPSFIIAHTKIAHGAGSKEGSEAAHGSPLGAEAIDALRKDIGWNYADFEVPAFIYETAQNSIKNNVIMAEDWEKRLSSKNGFAEYKKYISPNLNINFTEFAKKVLAEKPTIATRVASGKVLEEISKHIPSVIGGSADLSTSNNTINKQSVSISSANFNGNYIHYGIREHAMGAIMNGISCYDSGFIPYGGTFLVFSDFLRPAIRLAALMERQVIYVFTHDSISLGADGPTHQPIEHIESLRLIPNTIVLRPADLIETIECYKIALASKNSPTIMVLGRSNVPTLRTDYEEDKNLSSRGGYIISEVAEATINLISSGSDLAVLQAVQEDLLEQGIKANLVSVPFLSKFAEDKSYVNSILGNRKNFIIGTSTMMGWQESLSIAAKVKNITTFGKSGSESQVCDYFGFSKDKLIEWIKASI